MPKRGDDYIDRYADWLIILIIAVIVLFGVLAYRVP